MKTIGVFGVESPSQRLCPCSWTSDASLGLRKCRCAPPRAVQFFCL